MKIVEWSIRFSVQIFQNSIDFHMNKTENVYTNKTPVEYLVVSIEFECEIAFKLLEFLFSISESDVKLKNPFSLLLK